VRRLQAVQRVVFTFFFFWNTRILSGSIPYPDPNPEPDAETGETRAPSIEKLEADLREQRIRFSYGMRFFFFVFASKLPFSGYRRGTGCVFTRRTKGVRISHLLLHCHPISMTECTGLRRCTYDACLCSQKAQQLRIALALSDVQRLPPFPFMPVADGIRVSPCERV
jgi:hypothetical protein